MKLLINKKTTNFLKSELRLAEEREIGGILVAEHRQDEVFSIAGISVQRSGGTGSRFVRDPAHHTEFLSRFFSQTGHDYTRYNYIGEWHSHPSFSVLPSIEDCTTMQAIVSDPRVNVSFAILLVVRLQAFGLLKLSATAFRVGHQPENVDLASETWRWPGSSFRQARSKVIRRI